MSAKPTIYQFQTSEVWSLKIEALNSTPPFPKIFKSAG